MFFNSDSVGVVRLTNYNFHSLIQSNELLTSVYMAYNQVYVTYITIAETGYW